MKLLFKLLLAAAFLNAISWVLLIPIWQYPDEQSHFAQTQYYAEVGNNQLGGPSKNTSEEVDTSEKILGTQRDDQGNNKFTYHPEQKLEYDGTKYGKGEYEISKLPKSARNNWIKAEATLNPPLYYFLASRVYKIFSFGDLFTRVYALRVFSVLCFLLLITVTYKSSRAIYEKDDLLPIVLTATVAFTPMLVYTTTGTIPDAIIISLFTAFFYFCLKITKEGISIKNIVQILFVICLGAMTRQNFLITLFVLPLPIIHQFIFKKEIRKKIFALGVISLVALYTSSFFVPSLDFIRRLDYPESSQKIATNPLVNLTVKDHMVWTLRHTYAEVWPWFWGIYKWLSLSLPHVVYQVINRLMILVIVGSILKFVLIIKKRTFREESAFIFSSLFVLIYFFMITAFDYLFRKNHGYSFGIQGRYFLPIIVPAYVVLLSSVDKLLFVKKFRNAGLLLLVVLFIVFNFVSLYHVSSSYYVTNSFSAFVTNASNYKPYLLKGNIIAAVLTGSLIAQVLFLIKLLNFSKEEQSK